MSEVWVEQYRPQTLDDIVGHEAVVARMKSFVDDPEMPNLLFAGRQGIGKTAIVQAFAREKFGEDWESRTLTLNASDDRGINIVREDIKDFAQIGAGEYDYKIVFLDEADQLTDDAQPALRRTMEDYSDVTRFILSCNYPGQIIDPIQSRTAIFRLTPMADEQIKRILNRVVDGEGLDVEEDALEKIAKVARGDARHAINTLHGVTLDGQLDVEDAHQLLGVVDYEKVKDIVELAIDGDLDEAMDTLDEEVLGRGASVDSVIETFISVIKRTGELDELARMRALDAAGEADGRLRRGANPHVQYHALLSNLMLANQSSTGGYQDG